MGTKQTQKPLFNQLIEKIEAINIIAKQQYDLNMIHIEKDMFCLQMKPQACTYSTKFTSNQEVLISTQSRNINYVLQASTLPHLSASQPSHLKVTPKSTVYRRA